MREGYEQQQIVEWRKDGGQRRGLGSCSQVGQLKRCIHARPRLGGEEGDRVERHLCLELCGPGGWACWKNMGDVWVGTTCENRGWGQSFWRWDREFGPFERGCSQWACIMFQGLEAAGGQTLRSILRAVLATAQRGMRNEGESVEGFRVRACLAGTLKGPPSSSHIVLCLASNRQVIAWFPFQYSLLVRRTGFGAFFIEVLKLFPKLSRSCLSQAFPIF